MIQLLEIIKLIVDHITVGSYTANIIMRTTFIFYILLCSGAITAQEDGYNISTYVTPDFSYQILSVSPSLTNRKGPSSLILETELRSSFFSQKYSRKRISETTFSFNGENTRRKTTSDTTSTTAMIGSLDYRNQFFYKEKRFITLDGEGGFIYVSEKNIDETAYIGLGDISLKPHWGIGRTELVTDAWHAKAILKAFKKKGLLQRQPNQKEVEAFAQAITAIKNTRRLDFRFERIYEMEQMANYLGESGMVATDNFLFFATLNDAWLFEGFRNRRSGSTWQIGPTGQVLGAFTSSALFSVNGAESNTSSIDSRYGIETIYENYIAAGDFQIDLSAGIIYGKAYQRGKFNNSDITTNTFSYTNIDATVDVDYLVSSRIILGASFMNSYTDTDFRKYTNFTRFNFDIQYFIAPRLSITGNAGVFFNKTEREMARKSTNFFISMDYILL